MTQQHAMENIMMDWVRTGQNYAVAQENLGTNSKTAQGFLHKKNRLERILKSGGFVYRIIIELNVAEYTEFYIFRKERLKNYRQVHRNWLKKNNFTDWASTQFNEVELTVK